MGNGMRGRVEGTNPPHLWEMGRIVRDWEGRERVDVGRVRRTGLGWAIREQEDVGGFEVR